MTPPFDLHTSGNVDDGRTDIARGRHMKIGIIGAGSIGSTIARRLSRHGHDVVIANSRGPETIDARALSTGARAVPASEAAIDVDVLVVSVPLNRNENIAAHVRRAPEAAVVIDTSNYYPARDGIIPALAEGQPESAWLSELFGRPVTKAWNAITSQSFDAKATDAGTAGRVAIPVASDHDDHRKVAMSLVEQTGFDAVDAGVLAESWRQQPGAPVYCTDRTGEEMPAFLAAAEKERVPQRRDLAMEAIGWYIDAGGRPDGKFLVAINRACYS
ncbi:NADPH-dependent F420 reductase [Arthrobacter sp. MDT3-44]